MQAADQLSAVGDKIQEIGDKALDAYTDTENAVTKVNAYFGETGQAAEQSANVIKNVYSSGVGESMDAVANAVLMVKKNLGDLSETDLTNLTQQAIRRQFPHTAVRSDRSAGDGLHRGGYPERSG